LLHCLGCYAIGTHDRLQGPPNNSISSSHFKAPPATLATFYTPQHPRPQQTTHCNTHHSSQPTPRRQFSKISIALYLNPFPIAFFLDRLIHERPRAHHLYDSAALELKREIRQGVPCQSQVYEFSVPRAVDLEGVVVP
jgi:hypothetical protein